MRKFVHISQTNDDTFDISVCVCDDALPEPCESMTLSRLVDDYSVGVLRQWIDVNNLTHAVRDAYKYINN